LTIPPKSGGLEPGAPSAISGKTNGPDNRGWLASDAIVNTDAALYCMPVTVRRFTISGLSAGDKLFLTWMH